MDDIAAAADVQAQLGHACLVCGSSASFGFNTRDGSVWTCLDHRDAGERVLTPPIMLYRGPAASGR